MIYLPEKKFIFVSVPRTGSVSFQESLCQCLGIRKNELLVDGQKVIVSDHISAGEMSHLIGKDAWDSCWKVALARNPWDRVLSTYYYNRDGVVNRGLAVGNRIPLTLWFKYYSAKLIPFSLWLYLYPYHDCSSYICNSADEILVDTVFSFSSIDAAFSEVLIYLGKDDEALKKTNVSKGKPDYPNMYGKRQVCYVASKYYRDIAHFGWSFDSDDERNVLTDKR